VSGRMDWAATSTDAPHVYQEFLVPAMFAPLAGHLAMVVEAAAGDRALDVACGTGALTRELARRLAPGGRVVGFDLAQPMLDMARSQPLDGAATIEFVQGSAEQLPFADGDFSIVTCQQGLQFFPDRAGALSEFRRVLEPGGRLAVACWCDLESSVGMHATALALDRHFGTEVGDMVRNPFILNDPVELRGLLEAAGFDDLVIEIERVAARFREPERFAERFIHANPPAAIFAAGSAEQRRAVASDVAAALEPVRDGDTVTFEMPTLVAVARV
jgi:SAM-dependent methyltransferase